MRRPALATALVGASLLCLIFGPIASANAAPPDFSGEALLARLALQQGELTASDAAWYDELGFSVAISGDTALVGAIGCDPGGSSYAGAAYVFVRHVGVWTEQQKLTASDGAVDDDFGISVAISGDTALIGASWADVGTVVNAGAAYVFTRSGTTWTQQQKLTASDGLYGDHFGDGVAVSGDTALVGAGWHDPVVTPDAAIGAAYVFTRSGITWTQQQELTASDGAPGDVFGYSVALSGDTAAIGAPGHLTDGGDEAGVVYAFTRSGTTWTQQQELAPTGGGFVDQVGFSVALSGDTVVAGGPYADTAAGADAGAAWVFTRSGTTWTQQQRLTAADGAAAQDHFGFSVALSGDRVVVGAPQYDLAPAGADPAVVDAGAACVYTRYAGAWTQESTLTLADGRYNDAYGFGVALSGQTAVVGAPWRETTAGGNVGVARVYLFDSTPPVTAAALAPEPNAAGWNITPVSVTLTAADNSGGSGVALTEYRQKGAASWLPYTSPIAVITFGISGYEYRSTDFAGNIEIPQLVTVRIAPVPTIARLQPASARRRAIVVITGTGFGATRESGFVKFGTRGCTSYLSWSDTRIRCKVPANARFGRVTVKVTTVAGAGNGKSFRVKR